MMMMTRMIIIIASPLETLGNVNAGGNSRRKTENVRVVLKLRRPPEA